MIQEGMDIIIIIELGRRRRTSRLCKNAMHEQLESVILSCRVIDSGNYKIPFYIKVQEEIEGTRLYLDCGTNTYKGRSNNSVQT